MTGYAILDENNIVTAIYSGRDETDLDDLPSEFTSWEEYYGGKRTSRNTHGGVHYGQDGKPDGGVAFRKNFATIGGTYDPVRDAFIGPKPYPSWTLNEDTCLWEPPSPRPESDNIYYWDEDTTSWVEAGG
tara:strand:- start:122 stop:511 length:390 start_codon:yes stop_codon:yes gene_type:complete